MLAICRSRWCRHWEWTGGLGVIGDPQWQSTDYTPDAAELNSTVTLTFTGAPAYTGCPAPSDQMNITMNPLPYVPTFSHADFCGSTSGPAFNIATPGGYLILNFFYVPPLAIDPVTGVITNATPGNTYPVIYYFTNPCLSYTIVNVTSIEAPSGTLSGSASLCPTNAPIFQLILLVAANHIRSI